MAANAAMKAALVLNFKDELSPGLTKLENQLDTLKRLGGQLGLGGLENAFKDMERSTAAARGLASELRGVGNAAEGAWAKLSRMAGTMKRGMFGGAGAGRGGGMMGALAGIGGSYAALASVRSFASFEDLARTAAIASGVTGPLAVGAESRRLQVLFNRDALRTAQSGMSIGTAYSEMVGQGLTPAESEGLLSVHSRVAEAYGIDSATLTPATVALHKNLGISDTDMGGALAAMMTANYRGRFKAEDFALQLPGITGDMQTFGMKGRGAADQVFAALETVMQSASVAGQGAANFKDFLDYLVSPHAARSFDLKSRGMLSGPTRAVLDQYHITGFDMPQVQRRAAMHGIDPITATLDVLQDKIKNLPPDVVKDVLGAFFTNSQSRDAAQALLMHREQYEALRSDLHGVGAGTLDKAFEDRMAGAEAQTKLFDEELEQLERRLGADLMPVTRRVVHGLDDMNSALIWLDGVFPNLGADVISTGAGILGVGAAAAGAGLLLPKVAQGLWAFSAPLRLVAGLVAAFGGGVPALVAGGVAVGAGAAYLGGKAAGKQYGRMFAGEKPIGFDDYGTPIFDEHLWDPTRRADQEWVEHYGPGMHQPTNGRTLSGDDVAVAAPPTVHVLVGVDPDSGVVRITHTDSSGNASVTPIYQLPPPGNYRYFPDGKGLPDPGQTLGRP